MSSSHQLNEFEKGQISVLRAEGYTIRAIASKISRSSTVVHNYLRLGENYGKAPRSGRPKSLDERDKRRIMRLVDEGKSERKILAESQLNVSVSTIHRAIKDCDFYEYDSMDVKPRLTEQHKAKRLKFAQNVKQWNDEWISVIFSNEKKFNLDGPDGYIYFIKNTEIIVMNK